MADENVSDELARLWRLRTGARLGRPAGLDADRIVRTAVNLADLGGLSAATLPKIAASLGVTPMSLYRHIGSKDELIGLMADLAFGLVPADPGPADPAIGDPAIGDPVSGGLVSGAPASDDPILSEAAPGDGWRSALRRWALAQLAIHHRHPWLAQIPISGPPRGPNAIAWMDSGLHSLRATGLDWPAKIGVITVVSGYVRQASVTSRQLEEHRRTADLNEAQALRDYQRELAALVDPARFPDAAELFASGLFNSIPESPDTGDEDFTFGLELILDGVAATIMR
ncbi:TetR/AcrR family transcriptional regulator [Nocardia sp. NPDC051030]|uniref:TetR/AcrR family transcriptional regulator n=1 Tax=Nocardia sp. NPDC051030 TaxID=3155162 RepID=UPI0034491BDC